jgi:hypothetical protein
MQFLLVLSEDPELVAGDAARAEAVRETGEFATRLVADGALRGGAPLRPVAEGRRIRSRDGQERVLDGPFPEAKEVIAGYFVIEAGSLDEAVRIAAGCPNARFGSVEVREIISME